MVKNGSKTLARRQRVVGGEKILWKEAAPKLCTYAPQTGVEK